MNSETKTRRGTFLVVVPASFFVCLLAFAIFGWGLHSKLSLYHLDAKKSSNVPIAKLLSERERGKQELSIPLLRPPSLCALATAANIALFPRPLRSAEWRRDLPPPRQQLIALKGPSLRRPPPSLS